SNSTPASGSDCPLYSDPNSKDRHTLAAESHAPLPRADVPCALAETPRRDSAKTPGRRLTIFLLALLATVRTVPAPAYSGWHSLRPGCAHGLPGCCCGSCRHPPPGH